MSASPSQTSGSSGDAANRNGSAAAASADDKPRLTEKEKKQNHIASGRQTREHGGQNPGRSYTHAWAYGHETHPRSKLTSPSEQKRRQAIREGFDRLTELVPGLQGQGRSEGLVLKRTVDYMREQLVQRQALIDRVEQAGGNVDPKFKKWVNETLRGDGD
jgi:hypothetical protein